MFTVQQNVKSELKNTLIPISKFGINKAEQQRTIGGAFAPRGGSTGWSGTARFQPHRKQGTPDTGISGWESPGATTHQRTQSTRRPLQERTRTHLENTHDETWHPHNGREIRDERARAYTRIDLEQNCSLIHSLLHNRASNFNIGYCQE